MGCLKKNRKIFFVQFCSKEQKNIFLQKQQPDFELVYGVKNTTTESQQNEWKILKTELTDLESQNDLTTSMEMLHKVKANWI